MHPAIRAAGEAHSGRIAVIVGDDHLTYADLLRRAEAVRLAVTARPPGPVAGYFAHSLDAVAAFVGVLAAESAYVPLAPVQGRSRVAEAVAGVGAALILTDLPRDIAGLGAEVLDVRGLTPAEPEEWAVPDGVAYVIHTSGSTGRPKGVAVGHRALAASTDARLRLYGEGGTLFLAAPLCFDSSVSMFAPLATGGTVMLSSPGSETDAVRLAAEAAKATHALLLPSVYAELLELWGERQPGLPVAIVAGEAVPPALVARHLRLAPHRRLINEYGPTEAAVFCTAHTCTTADTGTVPIGRPIHGYEIALLDAELRPVPAGAVGEICVGGPGLAEGYLGQPGVTAVRFVPAAGGGRWYRTGDLGLRRPDGVLEYHGRTDDQVKIRGIRLELGEVENALAGLPGVAAAACVAVDGSLVGFVRPRGEVEPRLALIDLRERVPAYLIPRQLRVVAEFPLTATGKIDRRALAAQVTAQPTAASNAEDGPAGALIHAVATVLGGAPGPDESFADLGDSLAAMRVAARLHRSGWRCDPVRLLEPVPLAEVAREMTRRPRDDGRDQAPGPLSPSQLGVWYADRAAPGTAAYTITVRVRVAARLDPDRLRTAIEAVTGRHPVLTCRIETGPDGRPAMVQCPGPADVDVADLSGDPDPDAIADELRALEAEHPIDPAVAAPLRVLLVALPGERSELVISVHHAVCDGQSLRVLLREIAAAYSGSPLPPPVDFRRYAAGVAVARAADGAAAVAAGLVGVPAVVNLRDRDAPATLTPAARLEDLPPDLARGLATAAARHRTTLYAVLLAGFAEAIAAVTGRRSMIVGAVTAPRPDPALEETIGQFTNVVPIPIELDVADDPVGHAAGRLRAALRYDGVPFAEVVRATGVPRGTESTPLVQVILEFFPAPLPTVTFDGADGVPDEDEPQQGAVTDLALRVFPYRDGLRVVAVRDTSVVSGDVFDRLLGAARAAWTRIAADQDASSVRISSASAVAPSSR